MEADDTLDFCTSANLRVVPTMRLTRLSPIWFFLSVTFAKPPSRVASPVEQTSHTEVLIVETPEPKPLTPYLELRQLDRREAQVAAAAPAAAAPAAKSAATPV